MEQISKALSIVFIVFVLAVGGSYVFRKWRISSDAIARKELADQKLSSEAAEKQTVGSLAEAAAKSMNRAARECKRIEYSDLDECAKYQGILPKEQEIAALASEAVGSHEKFVRVCDKYYPHEECIGLLWRAFELTSKK